MAKFDRRVFLKLAGAGSAVMLAGCGRTSDSESEARDQQKTGEMTYRMNGSTGDRVSVLGYGMMRLPTLEG